MYMLPAPFHPLVRGYQKCLASVFTQNGTFRAPYRPQYNIFLILRPPKQGPQKRTPSFYKLLHVPYGHIGPPSRCGSSSLLPEVDCDGDACGMGSSHHRGPVLRKPRYDQNPSSYLWLAGKEGMEKKVETTIVGYMGTMTTLNLSFPVLRCRKLSLGRASKDRASG